ncbi:transcriptional regulator GcvA [Pseudolysobacter antarcticus]|uniref:Transcriptional regulator GcvA n=1 Tax=Pseudolysobacter antarcticus TaxID=2511995 RepID=A0A411HGQ2_9GAMM|nr:transcriptional regulator GcvA [Pseudolysobacter antarcticus]QBB69678.1 transcriptional regulator GcvA [Pseudolysobacter antarcticus]
MARRLPPLTALRAFEAAARHRSFTRAANELHVTQAAISHQVKQLEDWLGLKLFERSGHALTLTSDGKNYLPPLSKAFDALANATERLSAATLAGPLRITALPSFATKWLMPRLGRFQAVHPNIDLHVTSAQALHDFSSGEFDIGIRLGLGRWPGLRADLIAHENLSPLCSPRLLDGSPPLRELSDLRLHTLLHDQPQDQWPRWLETFDGGDPALRSGPGFSDSSLVLQAAIDGHGIALGRLFLAADDIAAGRLVKPFAQRLANDFSYWLVYPKSAAEKPRIEAFSAWLFAEVQASIDAVALDLPKNPQHALR